MLDTQSIPLFWGMSNNLETKENLIRDDTWDSEEEAIYGYGES